MKTLTKLVPLTAIVALTLAGCGDGGSSGGSSTASSSSSSGGVTGQKVDVTPCLNQMVGDRTVAGLVVPDVIRLNMAQTSGFPNGRKLLDPVIDVTLAVLFLKLGAAGQDATTFAKIPLDPSGNDVALPAAFPWLGAAQGGTPAAVPGTGYVFRTDAPTAYTRVDRMGMPAVSTALISSAEKSAYNDDTPAIDATGKWAPRLTDTLTGLTTALADDLTSLKLTPCAKIS